MSRLLPILITLLAAGCDRAPLAPDPGPPPGGILFHSGTIHAGGGAPAVADALLCRDGRVLALGELSAIEAAHDLRGVQRVDLGGATAVPGLQDGHGHVEGYGATLEEVDLVGAPSYDEVIARIAARAATLPEGTWITGRGWDHTLWPDAVFPEHGPLSEAVPDHPVWVRRVDGHAGLANRAALERAGLHGRSIDTPVYEGGRIVVDDRGHATGVLVDLAMPRVSRLVPPPSLADRTRRILAAQDALLALGLTCVHDMGVDDTTLTIYQELRDTGELGLRIVAYRGVGLTTPDADLAHLPIPPDPEDRFQAPGVKLMVDGALGSRGAALLAPYADRPDEVGLSRYTDEQLRDQVLRLARLGLQPATHAIGDRANRQVLDAYQAAIEEVPGFAALRPRIEHAQVVAVDDLARFEELGVIPSVQPTHATTDMRWAQTRVGPRRVEGAYAWRRLGVPRLAFGSDFPVERAEPLEGLYAAITRQDRAGSPEGGWRPDQRLTAAEALHAFAGGNAHAVHQEDRRGTLRPGAFCDLTVIDVDPAALTADTAHRLLDARVLMTVVNGEILYAAR